MIKVKNLLWLSAITKEDSTLVGGKAASLGELMKIGIKVPIGFVLTTHCYKQFFNQDLPEYIKDEILLEFDMLEAERVAVRSSAISEDSISSSWAGQLNTYINVTKDTLLDSIKKCWNSIHSQRAKVYAHTDGTSGTQLVGVIVQKMITSNISGVMFTVNPVNKNHNELMIESSFGLGELIVQGIITPDNFLIDKKSLQIKNSSIQSKETMLVFQEEKNKKISVPLSKRNKSSLSSVQITQITNLGITIENHYKNPQDIEWAIDSKGTIWILQSRPITSL